LLTHLKYIYLGNKLFIKSKVLILTYYPIGYERGGGISIAMDNLQISLQDHLELSNYYFKKDSIFDSFNYLFKLFKLIIKCRFDYIYINGLFSFFTSILPISLFFFSKAKLIISIRGMLKPSALKKNIFKLIIIKLESILLKKNTVLHVTDEVELLESKLYFNLSHKVILDFPPAQYQYFPNKNKILNTLSIVYLGRIDDIKNLLQLLQILKKDFYDKNYYGIKLNIIGHVNNQYYWDKCSKIISQINDEERLKINYFGFLRKDKINKIFQDSHILISLTKGENFGYTILEALSFGLPVIISNNTPFDNFEEKGIGYIVDLSNEDKIVNSIRSYYNLSNNDFQKLSNKVYEDYNNIIDIEDLKIKYFQLFKI
jgi:glycosyltransferase involved in cell wall biosynthesis